MHNRELLRHAFLLFFFPLDKALGTKGDWHWLKMMELGAMFSEDVGWYASGVGWGGVVVVVGGWR